MHTEPCVRILRRTARERKLKDLSHNEVFHYASPSEGEMCDTSSPLSIHRQTDCYSETGARSGVKGRMLACTMCSERRAAWIAEETTLNHSL